MYFGQSWKGTRILSCLLIACLVASVCGEEKPLRCMSCNKALHLASCEEIETCTENQVCYVEKISALGGEINYNAGCRDKEECDKRGCFGREGDRKRRETSPFGGEENKFRQDGIFEHKIYCHHCCDSEFCNMYGCSDDFPVLALEGSRCFSCDNVKSPEECQVIQNCPENRICYIEQYYLAGSETRYNTGCMQKRMCELLVSRRPSRRRRNTILYSECCNDHMCNRKNPLATEAPSRLSSNYKCPDPPSVPAASTATQASSTVSVGLCEDENVCSQYTKEYICVGQYVSWSRIHCPKFCGFCTETTTVAPPVNTKATLESCEDEHVCSSYDKSYICTGPYSSWSQIHCPKYCGFCSPPASLLCEDEHVCSMYDASYICTGMYKSWSEIHCPKRCGFCSTRSVQPRIAADTKIGHGQRPSERLSDSSDCMDKEECSIYGREYICVDDYIAWSTINCPVYCGLCPDQLTTSTASTAAPIPASECKDAEDCSIYGYNYICVDDYIPWATIHCPVYCNLCPGPTTTPTTTTLRSTEALTTVITTPPICQDNDDCDIYGFDYICQGDYLPWSQINCPVYCKLCPENAIIIQGGTTAPATTSSKSTTTTATTTTTKTTQSSTTTQPTTATTTTTTTTPKPTTSSTPIVITTTPPPTTTTPPPTTTTQTPTTTTPTPTTTTPTPTTTSPPNTTTAMKTTTQTTSTTVKLTTTTAGPSCSDVEDCSHYTTECADDSMKLWMYNNCRATCSWCDQLPPCIDSMTNCAMFGSVLCTNPQYASLKDQCKATCNLC